MRLALLCVAASVCLAQDALRDLTAKVQAEVNTQAAMRTVRAVWETDRWFTFPKFHETAANLAGRMKAAGLAEVEVLHAPADGESQAGYWTMPLAWDAVSARLEIVSPEVDAGQRVLADYRAVPASLCMWSGPTPPEGVTAAVVEQSGDAGGMRGKFVVSRRNPAGSKWQFARDGVAGVINTFTENRSLEDGRQWINAWGDNGWAFTKGSTPLPCFSISPKQAAFLSGLMQKHAEVRLKAVVHTRYYSDTYPYVTGVVRGANAGAGREEVLVLGHSAEQGAHDNATGVAAMVEALSALGRLIDAGKLPRPARTIRMLAMGELYASMHYVQQNVDRMRRTVAAFCVDTPAASYDLAGTEYTFYLNPHVARSYTDSLVLKVADAALSPRRPFHSKPFMPGTDTFLADPMIGVPTVWPYSGTGVNTHHNSEDKPETVDSRSLRDLTVIAAAYLYAVASAGPDDAERFARYAAEEGRARLVSAAARPLERLAMSDPPAYPQLLRIAFDSIEYHRDREAQAVESAGRLGVAPEKLAPLVETLRAFAETQKDRLLRFARQRSPEVVAAERATPGSARTIVRRKRIGTLPLDEIRPDQREGFPSGAWDTRVITALYWTDGRRSLDEVVRMVEMELGPSKFDWVGYFGFLAKRGYVELLEGSN